MLYGVEEVKTERNKKLVIVYILMLLLVFVALIGVGILVLKIVNNGEKNKTKETVAMQVETENKSDESNEKNKENKDDTMVIITKGENKENFIQNVDNIYNGKEEKRVFLTFDDGPSQSVTPHILDILKKYNIKATFFVLGSRVSSNQDLICREYEEGHYIANHGYSHKYSKIYASSSAVLEEYNKTEQEIKKALNNENYSSNLFRFPGGSFGGEYNSIKQIIKKDLKKNNIAYLDWNALTNDSAGANTKEKILKNLKSTVGNKNNVVVLMHDAPDKKLTYETLEDVIQYLQEKGYKFKNMYDLMD